MDQGIIKNLNHFYICQVIQHLLTEPSQNLHIILLNASRIYLNACFKVCQKPIAGFTRSIVLSELFDEENLPPLLAWEGSISFQDYTDIDENINICRTVIWYRFLSEVLSSRDIETEYVEDIKDEVEETRLILTSTNAIFHPAEYRRYLEWQYNVREAVFLAVDILGN